MIYKSLISAFISLVFILSTIFTLTNINVSAYTGDPQKVLPLFENSFNESDKDRVNLFFIYDDALTDFPNSVEQTREILTIDGQPNDNGGFLSFGMFATEPFKSNQDKFNIWYYDEQLNQTDAFDLMVQITNPGQTVFPDLDYITPIYMKRNNELNTNRSFAQISNARVDPNSPNDFVEFNPAPVFNLFTFNR